jgi:YD repeat-containing protein
MFLPQAIGDYILDFSYRDAGGTERKLVSEVEILNRAVNRPPVLERPRRQWIRELILGLLVAGFLIFLRFFKERSRSLGGFLWGLIQAALGLFFGFCGSVLFFMTFFTDHDYTWHNINVLFVNPLWFAAVVWGIRFARAPSFGQRKRPEFLLKWFWTGAFILCFLTIPIKLLPFFYQQNQVTQALLLPITFVLSWFPDWLRLSGKAPREAGPMVPPLVRPLVCLLFLTLPGGVRILQAEAPESSRPSGALEAPGAAESPGLFPLSLVVEAIQGEAGRWRPDWPPEIPPDAFAVRDALAIELELGEEELKARPYGPVLGRYRLEWDALGRLIYFPLVLPLKAAEPAESLEPLEPAEVGAVEALAPVREKSPLFAQVRLRYGEGDGIEAFDIEIPGPEPIPLSVRFTSPYFPGTHRPPPVRVEYGERLYHVLFSGGIQEIAETWFDPWGIFSAYFKGRIGPLSVSNGPGPGDARTEPPWRILGLASRPLEPLRGSIHYESGGNISESSGEYGSFSAIYGKAGRPLRRSWDGRDFSLQWDQRGLLVRQRDLGGDETGAFPVDFRYDYEFDSWGNWIRRRETALFRIGDLLLPGYGRDLVRRIVYAGEGHGGLD